MGKTGSRPNHNEASLWGSLAIAIKEIKAGVLPDWFRKHYCDKEEDGESEIERIIREHEFPRSVHDEFLALPLGLHLSLLESPTPPSRSDREALKSLKLHLNKATDLIIRLERAKMDGFGPELVEVTVPQDDTNILGENNVGAFGPKSVKEPAPTDRISFKQVEGPSKIFRQYIKAFLEHLAATEQPKRGAGPEPGSLWWAQRALDRFVRDYAPGHSLVQKTKLSKELFERVREHHGHKRREDNDTPRHRDLVLRAAQANTRKNPSRKIGKKKD